MHGVGLQKTSQRDAMAQDLRRDLLGRERDILLRDRDVEDFVRDEIETLVHLETETSRPRPHPWYFTKTVSSFSVF